MAVSATTSKLPIHPLALAGFGLSLLSIVLAFYGSLYAEKHLADSPLREARGWAGLPGEPKHWYERLPAVIETKVFGDRIDSKMVALTSRSKIANYSLQLIAFVMPFVLGITAALLGGWAMTAIEQSAGRYAGNMQSVFSMLIGSFAAVIAGCMLLSLYIWPLIPSPYTT
jgi:hypothetical protein